MIYLFFCLHTDFSPIIKTESNIENRFHCPQIFASLQKDPMETPSQPLPSLRPAPALRQRLLRLINQGCRRITMGLLVLLRTSAGHNGKQTERIQLAKEKRQSPRIYLTETPVHVTNGCLSAHALLDNISADGICLRNLSEQIFNDSVLLTVFSNDDPAMPVVQIEPRWAKIRWDGTIIGGAVIGSTHAWRCYFVHTAERFAA